MHVSPPRSRNGCNFSWSWNGHRWDQLHTGDASASGHITPSFGGITVAVIGAETGAGGAGVATAAPPANAGLGGKNGGRAGRPAIGGGKGEVPTAEGMAAGDPANGGKAPGGGGMNPGGGAKCGIL